MSINTQQAPESNPPITPWYYQPSLFQITNITRGMTTIVTMAASTVGGTTVDPNYTIGQLVKIHVTFGYGMKQINNQEAYVISVPTTFTVVLALDSRSYDPFITSPVFAPNPSQIIAIGDINSGNINSNGLTNQNTNVIGSFINISNPTNVT